MSLLLVLSLVFLFGVLMPSLGLKSGSEPVTKIPTDTLSLEEISFESDGLTLQGWWLEAQNPRATLVFVHGAGSSRISWFFNTLQFYEQLQKAGISVFTFDQRNHGNSDYTDGYLRMGAVEHRDVMAAREWVGEQTDNETPQSQFSTQRNVLTRDIGLGAMRGHAYSFNAAVSGHSQVIHCADAGQ